ncbi:MAG: aminoglycoside phosphotransferase family protein [Waddliaceae bacterium]
MSKQRITIDTSQVRSLVYSQFPNYSNLKIRPVDSCGWDNYTFHLGEDMLVRLPSAADYELQVEKEHTWLPKLAPKLPLAIPELVAMGKPGSGYPWKWSIYRWIEGESAASAQIADECDFAKELAQFLTALQKISSTGGPKFGVHSFDRGGSLRVYDADTKRALDKLEGRVDGKAVTDVWNKAIATHWVNSPVWVHGDISSGNLLVKNGKLHAVIDFGQLAIGDPACDLAIAWTMFKDRSRKAFREAMQLDDGTWARGGGWALWKAVIVAAGLTNPNNTESSQCWRIIDEVLSDFS